MRCRPFRTCFRSARVPGAYAPGYLLSTLRVFSAERSSSGGLRPRLLAFDPSGLLCGAREFRRLAPPATCFRPFGSSLRNARLPAAYAAGYLLSTLRVFSAERASSGGLRRRLLAFGPAGLRLLSGEAERAGRRISPFAVQGRRPVRNQPRPAYGRQAGAQRRPGYASPGNVSPERAIYTRADRASVSVVLASRGSPAGRRRYVLVAPSGSSVGMSPFQGFLFRPPWSQAFGLGW
ncbi:MAG: hypothetical protein BWX88_02650 [Planctomycetes bacterium ADurb.Bin126]|nr:MAG: hypothetical protein BWX88_02650 [Planctomycetes bacterium ADurb.Bin126]